MKLCKLLINAEIFDPNKTYLESDLIGYPTIAVFPDNEIPINYVDVTSVATWVASLSNLGMVNRDYGYMRDFAKAAFVPIWNTLTFEEKKILVKYYIYPETISAEEWATYYSNSENYLHWNYLAKETRDSVRLARLYAAFSKVSYDFTTNEVAAIYLISKPYCIDYWMANLPHLVLWISNGSLPALGIDFTSNGLAQRSGYTTAKRDALLDIIVNGNY